MYSNRASPALSYTSSNGYSSDGSAVSGNSADSERAVPRFLSRLWAMVSDNSVAPIVSWTEEGVGFVIHHQTRFVDSVLPRYFKHKNLGSFVRQLNVYGFRKVFDGQPGAEDRLHYHHDLFRRGRADQLKLMRRNAPPRVRRGRDEDDDDDLPEPANGLEALRKEINMMRDVQSMISKALMEFTQQQKAIKSFNNNQQNPQTTSENRNRNSWDDGHAMKRMRSSDDESYNSDNGYRFTNMCLNGDGGSSPEFGAYPNSYTQAAPAPLKQEGVYQSGPFVHDTVGNACMVEDVQKSLHADPAQGLRSNSQHSSPPPEHETAPNALNIPPVPCLDFLSFPPSARGSYPSSSGLIDGPATANASQYNSLFS